MTPFNANNTEIWSMERTQMLAEHLDSRFRSVTNQEKVILVT